MPDSLTAPVHKLLSEGLTLDQVIVELRRWGMNRDVMVQAIHRATTLPLEDIRKRIDVP